MEFVNLPRKAQIFGSKHLLYTQMEIISIQRRYQNYKKLKAHEIKLKKKLEKKILEAQKEVVKLHDLFPKIENKKLLDSPIYIPPRASHRLSPLDRRIRDKYERETEEIRRKIEQLDQEI
jgi:hypothetical protein